MARVPFTFTGVQLPGAPVVSSVAMSGLSAVSVSFSAPVSDGGSAVTGYACYAYPTASGGSVVASALSGSSRET